MDKLVLTLLICCAIMSCSNPKTSTHSDSPKTRVLLDTDTNNELDDQHALAYLLLSGQSFELAGVTVNATVSGGRIPLQYEEAERVMRLCGFNGTLPIYKGANSTFDSISRATSDAVREDGHDAVRFIIQEAKKSAPQKLVVIAVGKLTNVALALKADPDLAQHIRLVWLGSNYPEAGEYNMVNDTASVNFVMNTNVPLEVVPCRYGKPSGADAVRATMVDIRLHVKGQGPQVAPVTGRHGGSFTTFGDYAANLFEHAHLYGTPPARALFDLVAVAVVKDEGWGSRVEMPAPHLVKGQWVNRPQNTRKMIMWENFDKSRIMANFYEVMQHPQQVKITP